MSDKQLTIKEYLAAPAVMKRTEEMLTDRASQFVTSVLSLAGSDPKLMAAEPRSLFNACLVAASLNLPINKNLGFAHIIPYKNNRAGITEAQFQMGWKGFVQLAQRTGQYQMINAVVVYEGQLVKQDRLRGNRYNWDAKTGDAVIGYVSIFALNNGFEHELYMSRDEMEAHARRYSRTYSYDLEKKAKTSPWSTDFDTMGLKTVNKLNISKYGPLSIEIEKALVSDQAILRGDEGKPEYVDGTDLLDDEKGTEEQKDAIVAEFGGEEVEMTEAEKEASKAFKGEGDANGNDSPGGAGK